MSFSNLLPILWALAAIGAPVMAGAGILWLKSQFPTRAELKAVDEAAKAAAKELAGASDALEKDIAARFERGSRKFAEHDRRIALVEDDCKKAPTKNDLNQGMTVLAGRLSGVESSLKGVEKQLGTQHDYLRTLLERAPGP